MRYDFVILKRIIKNVSPVYSNKSHFHHKLLELGFYTIKGVIILWSLQTIFSRFFIVVFGLTSKITHITITII